MGVLIFLLIAGFIYFIPAITAYNKHKRNKEAVLILNLFLGWTMIGWVIALVWAVMKDESKTETPSAPK